MVKLNLRFTYTANQKTAGFPMPQSSSHMRAPAMGVTPKAAP